MDMSSFKSYTNVKYFYWRLSAGELFHCLIYCTTENLHQPTQWNLLSIVEISRFAYIEIARYLSQTLHIETLFDYKVTMSDPIGKSL